MNWKRILFGIETRAASYTDAVTAALVASTSGASSALPAATGALEAAAGFVGRCFAAATVEASPLIQSAITPQVLCSIGRELIKHGESVLYIDVLLPAAIRLHPVSAFEIHGGFDPVSWLYRLELAGPDSQSTATVPRIGVIHVKYSVDPARPWAGVGPIESASIAGRLSAETAQALADESAMTRGGLLPIPAGGDDPSVSELKADIKKLRGRVAVVEAQDSTGWGDARQRGTGAGWKLERIGAEPPKALVDLSAHATAEVLAACGVSPALFGGSDGTALRESFRQTLHTTVTPLGRLAEAELSEKLEDTIKLDFSSLYASDTQGRSRAVRALVDSGMSLNDALETVGFT